MTAAKKIGLSSRGRVCFKIFAANVVLDLLQGVEVAFKNFFRHDCSEKKRTFLKGQRYSLWRVCCKVFAADVVLDFLQGVKVAFTYFVLP